MKTNVNFATKDDINKLVEIYSEWSKFKEILPKQLIEADSPEDLIKYFNSSNKTRKYLIATNKDNDPLGACYIDTTFLGLNNIRLGDMIIKEKYRRHGVGSILIKNVIKYAQKNKIKKIWLWTQEELKPAIKLYENNGFVLEGRQKKQFCNKDALLFGLILKNRIISSKYL